MQTLNLCQCGCGKVANTNRRFVIGHNSVGKVPWNKGIKRGPMTEEQKLKHVENSKNTWADPAIRQRRIEGLKKAYADGRKKPVKKFGDENSSRRPEMRRKFRRIGKAKFKSGYKAFDSKHISPEYFTDIEKIIADELTRNNIGYFHNHKIGPFYVDFLIFSNVVLECDGFWHDFKKRQKRDKRRDQYLIKKGYSVYHLGWKKIQEDSRSCIESVLASRK